VIGSRGGNNRNEVAIVLLPGLCVDCTSGSYGSSSWLGALGLQGSSEPPTYTKFLTKRRCCSNAPTAMYALITEHGSAQQGRSHPQTELPARRPSGDPLLARMELGDRRHSGDALAT